MNKAIALDTHAFVKHLMESGFSEQQAEGLASAQVNLLLNSNLATKADLDIMKAELMAEIGRLESKIIWMMLIQSIAIVGLVVTLIKV